MHIGNLTRLAHVTVTCPSTQSVDGSGVFQPMLRWRAQTNIAEMTTPVGNFGSPSHGRDRGRGGENAGPSWARWITRRERGFLGFRAQIAFRRLDR